MGAYLADERVLRPDHAELVTFGIGQYRPRLFAGLPDIDTASAKADQALDLLVAILSTGCQVHVHPVLHGLGVGDRHEADAYRRVHVRADDDFPLALRKHRPAKRLRPEPSECWQIVGVNDDVVESHRHAASMRGW